MSQTLLSTLVPCYNHEDFIRDTIESIWKQNIDNMEIIVIDDGSKDKSFEVLKKLQASSPVPMHISTQDNVGLVKTLNRCLAKAQGKYISLIGSDDLYFPSALVTLLEDIQKEDALKVIYANAREFKGDVLFEKMHQSQITDLLALTTNEIEKKLRTEVPRPLLTQCAIFEKSLLEGIHGWDETLMLDDWPLNIEIFEYLSKHNYKHDFIDIDLVKYRFHESNMHKNYYKMYLMIEEVILRYTPKELQKKFLSKEAFEHGKILLKKVDPATGTKLLFKSQLLDFDMFRFLDVLRLTIKYNLKSLFQK
ncbi:MAG: hypothetical protein COB07_06090 [Sulfurovum sp.]|nr:MAG: hypothetical protein COB07_06090 [Sulfurovum sp.]